MSCMYFRKNRGAGKKTAKADVELVTQRLRAAREDYEVRHAED